MADETPNKGDINFNTDSANTGLNMDNTPSQVAKGSLTYALNAALENYDSNSVNYQNELGNELCLNFPKDYVVIGRYFISEQSKHIFFLSNPSTGDSEIGHMLNNDCVYHTIINAKCLNFDQNFPIHKVVHKTNNCDTEIYWAQPNADRRYLNLDNIPYLPNYGSSPCNESLTNVLDCNQLRVQPMYSIPQITVKDVIIGGNIIAGVYQFGVQYSDALGNPLSSVHSITNPTPIADPQFATVNFNYPVGKSIVLNIDNLELGGQFDFFNLVVIKTINAITSVELVGTYQIDSESKSITYSGQNQTLIRLTINDVFEKFPLYGPADDVTTAQDVLIWKGLSSPERVSYQKIANNISLLWETVRIPATENYSEELNATYLRGYLRDEVYPFEFVPLLKSGKQTDGFHIPGRAQTINETLQPYIDPSNNDYIEDPTMGPVPYWRVYNTAVVIGDAEGKSLDLGYKGPWQYGAMAYWESEDKYPCDEAIWGELANTPIRHHKFPDVLVSPIIETKVFTGVGNLQMGNDAVFPIGVRIDTEQIKSLIANSDLTPEQKADIVGYKIVRGDRTDNKSIVAKGILRNVGKYTREEEDFYYPNYPYNDINADPFLNANNNAWSLLCDSFNIDILQFNNTDSTGSYTEIQYTDCNTNKTNSIKYRTLGKQELLCSTTKPTLVGAGIANHMYQTTDGPKPVSIIIDPDLKALISYANYDVWELESLGICGGWRGEWNDAYQGPGTKQYVDGFASNGNRFFKIFTRVGDIPNCVEYCTVCGINIRSRVDENVRVATCGVTTPITPIKDNDELAHRQIFNSPETSFGQPFLGDVIKAESVMYGAGQAHFVEVKDNAKYRLLSEDAQRIAAASADAIADPSDDIAAFYTAYQAYITIYINGITRKNYAQSFNSIADYNYSVGVPNNLGVKQRRLDIKKYLIPAIQSVGEPIDINNFQRETSVYLKTDEDKPPLPFPHENPAMAATPVVEHSRFTIGCTEGTENCTPSCATPVDKKPISVVSYYASLKNTFRSQWGQIYSYDTIDTGFQVLFDSNVDQPTIVFGGDTFISRFAFKTKVPFFIDNRVGAPDDSDIFYDEIGNIGYPKFWHSSRSILEDVTTSFGTLTNFITYKAHNFDCPNGPPLEGPVGDPNRLFYDGYFYLFAYGIPNFYVETSYNTDLRQAFNNKEGDFWPHVSTSIPDDWVQESFVSIQNDNTYYYNTTFSKQNKENLFTHLPANWKFVTCNYTFPFRAIFSDPQNSTIDTTVNNWLTYRASAYFDFPQNYGALVSLDGIENKQVLARFENKSLLYNAMYTTQTNTGGQVYLGQPLFSKSSPPLDFAETDLGYIGSQHKFLLKIPQGQISVDAKRGQVFLLNGSEAVKDLSIPGSGMNRFFTDHLEFGIKKYFPDVNIDNNFKDIGLCGVYDNKFDRVLITKKDYIPIVPNIIYDNVTKEFYIEKKILTPVFGEVVKYGIIYNDYVVTDSRNISNIGWHVPTSTELNTLQAYMGGSSVAGGRMKEVGLTYWASPNIGATNQYKFNLRGTGYRADTGPFQTFQVFATFWSSTGFILALAQNGNAFLTITSSVPKSGASIRLIKDSTTLSPGEEGIYIGNDGRKYRTICIGTQEWLADNLAETKYRNGDAIPIVAADAAWAALTTGAMAYPNNDFNTVFQTGYIGDEEGTIREKISVTDPQYFCNVSWTLSYSLLTNSWISFHSYLPNYYVGENNFFYSGIKSCCVDFDYIAGELVPDPPTTTTTTTVGPTTTSTTSTTTTLNCVLVGTVTLTDCELEGTAVITVPPACKRPVGVVMSTIYTGYNVIAPPSTVVSTATLTTACNAKNFVFNNPTNISLTTINLWSLNLNIGTILYADNGTNNCVVIPDGFYYTTIIGDPIIEVVGGVIVNLWFCNVITSSTTSTTSTTTTCVPSYSFSVQFHACANCDLVSVGSITNGTFLTVGKWYPVTLSGTPYKMYVFSYLGCNAGVAQFFISDSSKQTLCTQVISGCPSTTTSTTL